jgi:putative membrane protein
MISKQEQNQIRDLIAKAERKSHTEIVPMIVSSSDTYPAANFRCAIIVSFLFSLGLYFSPLSIVNPIYYLWIQLPGLLLGYYLGQIPVFTRLLITKSEIEFETRQRAYEAFFEHGIHLTKRNNGVLIFISLLERRIRIVTDKAVKDKIEQKIWEEIISQFAHKVQKESLAEALKQTIEATANVLEYYFPGLGDRPSELKNDLIIE